MSCPLLGLPADLLGILLIFVSEPSDLISGVAPTCRALRIAATADSIWRAVLASRYQVLLHRVFGGIAPMPRSQSWLAHYFVFAQSWMEIARDVGRTVFMIDGRTYDVTDFVDLHPGEPRLLLAAAGTDASELFAAIGHTENARQIMRRFDLGDLELPRDVGLRNREPPSALTSAMAALASAEGRRRVGAVWSTVRSALVYDLTERREYSGRLAPAVLRQTGVRLQALYHSTW